MSIKELIEKYEGKFPSIGMNISTTIKFKTLWDDILKLEESQKPTVPKFVADWYEEHKGNFDESIWEYLVNWEENDWDNFKRELYTSLHHQQYIEKGLLSIKPFSV